MHLVGKEMVRMAVILTYFSTCTAFLFVNNCLAPPPCTCYSSYGFNYIRCNSKGFTEIPNFRPSTESLSSLKVNLYGNKLTVIPDNAFINLSTLHTNNLDIEVQTNNIHTIEDNAFAGIENMVQTLYLAINNLSVVPTAIGKLTNLRAMYMFDNPLQSLDATVLSKIGRSLTYINFDTDLFTQWPDEIHYLTRLQRLAINKIPWPNLKENAFSGLENTLVYLQLSDSKLEKVPSSICSLRRLNSFYLTDDKYLQENGSTIFQGCNSTLPSVTELHLGRNELHSFPDVFSLFPSLTSLYLDFNNIERIDTSLIPLDSRLTRLDLMYNKFDRIPPAVNMFKQLKTLSIPNNNITTVGSSDLYGLPNLVDLDLGYNNISHISPDAFLNNLKLQKLAIENSNLSKIPLAVTKLPNLSTLRFNGYMNCTCNEMAYLKGWNITSISDLDVGVCDTSFEKIKSYLINTLPKCP